MRFNKQKRAKTIKCNNCLFWDLDRRLSQICKACNNSKRMINPQSILCNMCEQCLYGSNCSDLLGLKDITVSGGYFSNHLLDGNLYKFNLCEECLRKLFNQFKIKPIIKGYDGNLESFEKDQEYYEYRIWVKDGGFHQAYINNKCNAIKNCRYKAIYSIFCNNIFTEEAVCKKHERKLFLSASEELRPFINYKLKVFL